MASAAIGTSWKSNCLTAGNTLTVVEVIRGRHDNTLWSIGRVYGWDTGLPVPIWGVPDCWPHIVRALENAGYRADPSAHQEHCSAVFWAALVTRAIRPG